MSERLIGVDVGGTKVSVAVLDGPALGEPLLRPTCKDSSEALVDQLVTSVREAMGEDGAAAVGVGIPSTVDWARGAARTSVNVPLTDVPLRDLLRERLGVPVYVDNDANVAALAEATGDDGEPDVDSLVMFTVGTGVGGGIVLGGRIYHGATGASAELGHTIVAADASGETFAHSERHPQPGSLERLAAGRALDALGVEHGFEDGPHVVDAAWHGDERAREVIAVLGRRLALGVANAINTFDPEVVALGGGVSAAGELLLEPVREEAARFVLPGVGTRTEIRIARSGPRAGVRGAALLAGQELRRERGRSST